MCMSAPPPNSGLKVPMPPNPSLGGGLAEKSRLTIQGRGKQLDEQIKAAGG